MIAAKQEWSNSRIGSQLGRALRAYGGGAKLAELPVLDRMICDGAFARQFLADLARRFVDVLAEHPLAQAPFLHNYSPGLATMQLAAGGRASLSLVVYEELSEEHTPQSICFSDRDQHELVIAGEAGVDIHQHLRTGKRPVETIDLAVSAGDCINTSGPMLARHIRGVRGSFVMLQLSRSSQNAMPSREIRLSDGALLRQSSGDKRVSQLEMAMAVLGAMGRNDAADVMAQMSNEGPDHLRWEAVRQALHLDAREGFAALCGLAANDADSLNAPAKTLRNDLIRTYPELTTMEGS